MQNFAANLKLVQTGVEQLADKQHSCSYAQDRNKANNLPDFYNQTSLFTDNIFPKEDALFWADRPSEKNGFVAQYADAISWFRISSQFPNSSLWGENGISPMDIRQGALGNCWFLAAASALAEKPSRLEQIFLNNSPELNSQGIYGVNLYSLGVKHTVIIDDFLPLEKVQQRDWSFAWETVFAHVAEDSSMWGPILEKALAKLHGNYEHIIEGNPREATLTLTGSPSLYQVHENFDAE